VRVNDLYNPSYDIIHHDVLDDAAFVFLYTLSSKTVPGPAVQDHPTSVHVSSKPPLKPNIPADSGVGEGRMRFETP
jgi:hypothetical protein